MAARPHRVAPLTTLAQEHTPLGSQERVSIEPGDASRSATSPKGLTFGTTPRRRSHAVPPDGTTVVDVPPTPRTPLLSDYRVNSCPPAALIPTPTGGRAPVSPRAGGRVASPRNLGVSLADVVAKTGPAAAAAAPAPAPERLLFLDGIRGWACVSVIIYHCYYHGMAGGQPRLRPTRSFGAGYIVDGHAAVELFWAVSGFSLACITRDEGVARAAAARLPRLAIPVLFAVVVGYAFDPRQGAAAFFLNPLVALLDLLRHGVITTVPFMAFNFGQLWTMATELRGSFLVFLLSLIGKHVARPRGAAVAVLCWLYYADPDLNFFVVGVICRGAHRVLWPALVRTRAGYAAGALSLGGFFALHVFLEASADKGGLHINDPRVGLPYNWARLIRVALAFAAVSLLPPLRRGLETTASVWLGAHSYGAYICHMLFIGVLRSLPVMANNPALFVPLILLCAFGASAAVLRPVDSWAMRVSKRFGAWAVVSAASPAGAEVVVMLPRKHAPSPAKHAPHPSVAVA